MAQIGEFLPFLFLIIFSISFVWSLKSGKIYTRALIGRKLITRQDNPFLYWINILSSVVGMSILLAVNFLILLPNVPGQDLKYHVYLSLVMK